VNDDAYPDRPGFKGLRSFRASCLGHRITRAPHPRHCSQRTARAALPNGIPLAVADGPSSGARSLRSLFARNIPRGGGSKVQSLPPRTGADPSRTLPSTFL
jgi:hypothetical protein